MNTTQKKGNSSGFVTLLINIIIPSVILTKFSGAEDLGARDSLIISLLLPFSYGIYDYLKNKTINFISLLGLISLLLTGGVGLLQLNKHWITVKETAFPLIFGIVILISQKTKNPLVRNLLGQILDLEKIDLEFEKAGHPDLFKQTIDSSTLWLASTFFLSAILNYILAFFILEGKTGTTQFNESLGKMTALSFPVISIPTLIMMGFIIYNLNKSIKKYTNLKMEDLVKT